MSPQARMAAGNAALPEAGVSAGSAGSESAGAGPFVINLCSSTTPMALAHPDSPELKRFSFFVSRRREDNRERFRLHMGYFGSLAEAEEWLNAIRDLYPGAWAGEAPGKKLRARAAAAELAKQLPAPPSASRTAPPAAAPVTTFVPPVASKPAQSSPMRAAAASAQPAAPQIVVPTLQAAPVLPPPQATMPASAAPMFEAVAQAAAALAAVAKTAMAQSAAPTAVVTPTFAPPPAQEFVTHTFGPPASTPAPAARRAPMAPALLGAPLPAFVGAKPAAQQPPQAARPAGRAAASPPPVSVSAQPAAPVRGPAPQQPQRPAAAAPARPAAPPQAPAKAGKKPNALTDGSNVREVMASLDELGETRQMPIPPGLRAPAQAAKSSPVASAPAATAATRSAGGAAGRAPSAPVQSARGPAQAEKPRAAAPAARVPAVVSPTHDSMSDTQVLRMLETRRTDESVSDDANAGIALVKPDDTQTLRALKEAVIENAPVSFAVQLQWSVQPVELDKVPPLAIFSAYTLYTVEGSREGRKWYGLRLGFFSDAISAKQVAYYVRSEFTSVAVVPVSPAEKTRASDKEAKAATGAFQRKHVEQKIEEFKLFDDDKLAASASPPPKAAEPAAKPGAAGRGAPTRKQKPLGRVRAKEQRSPKTLEETLEILGASDLEIDNGRGEILNDTGVRHLRVEIQKNTPFAKLLDRLSERVRKN